MYILYTVLHNMLKEIDQNWLRKGNKIISAALSFLLNYLSSGLCQNLHFIFCFYDLSTTPGAPLGIIKLYSKC